MKRREIVKRIAAQARAAGVSWEVQREGANHTVYRLGATMIPVPRHVEIGRGFSEDFSSSASLNWAKDGGSDGELPGHSDT